jgi:hypothetical protein
MSEDIFNNAKDFVDNAINFALKDDLTKPHSIKYTILSLYSAIELLLKYKLYKEHWSLIFKDVNTASEVKLRTGDFVSVNYIESSQRLKNICEIDLSKYELIIKDLQKKRNKLEHYHLKDNPNELKAIVLKSLQSIFEYIRENLPEKNSLISNWISQVQPIKEFVGNRREELIKLLGETKELYSCPYCLEKFMEIKDDQISCHFCHKNFSNSEEDASEYVHNILKISEYEEVKNGGIFPVFECPECDTKSLVVSSRAEHKKAICFSCFSNRDVREYLDCEACGCIFIPDDEDDFLCTYCANFPLLIVDKKAIK